MIKKVWNAWKKIAEKIAHVQAHLILGLIYILVVAPTALLLRLLHQDPLSMRWLARATYWHDRTSHPESPAIDMKRQY